jgi:hypothetical protein
MAFTFLIPGKRSGAERSKPRTVLDLNVSEVLAKLSRPLLNFLNAYAKMTFLNRCRESARKRNNKNVL